MDESNPKSDRSVAGKKNEKKLKYLDFVAVGVVQAVVCLSGFYEKAKENAGPLRSGVAAVEATVKAVLGPVCDRFHDVPFELLAFADHKFEVLMCSIDRNVPATVKSTSSHVYAAAHTAPMVARKLASEVQHAGVSGAARSAYQRYAPVAVELGTQYKPVAEKYALASWQFLNRLPLFPQAAQLLAPTASYWAEKYNGVVKYAGEQGYRAAEYAPMIPTKRIAKLLSEGDARGEAGTAQSHRKENLPGSVQ